MNYKDKDYIDGSAPDGFDLDKCPVYQAEMAKLKQDKIRADLKQIMEQDDDKSKRNLVNII